MSTDSSSTIPWYRFHIWAVLAGAAVDVVSSNITTGCFGVIYVFVVAQEMASQGLTTQEFQTQLAAQLILSPVTLALGILCSLFAGYVT